jgi:hypothetical protein
MPARAGVEGLVLTTEALTDSGSMSLFQKPFMLSNNPSCVLDRHVIGPLKKSFLPTLEALLLYSMMPFSSACSLINWRV